MIQKHFNGGGIYPKTDIENFDTIINRSRKYTFSSTINIINSILEVINNNPTYTKKIMDLEDFNKLYYIKNIQLYKTEVGLQEIIIIKNNINDKHKI